MAWNEPGGGGNRDPWGGRKDEGPPDLDELARKLRERMNGLFGGRKGGSGKPFPIFFVILVGLLAWVLSGVYIIEPAERGVVMRLGKFHPPVMAPGPHWYLRGIDTVDVVDVDSLRTDSHRARMLTKDENIVQVELAVQYQVKDAKDYAFNVRDPELSLQEATESALREVIGGITLDDFLSGGRGIIVQQTKELTQEMLDKYRTGLILTSVNLQDPQPPEEVQGAFEDAIKAQEDEQRYKNQAEAYALDILPKARGDATRLHEAAVAYRQQVIARAEGDSSRFLQTLTEYEKAPDVTRKRMYLDTIEAVLSNTSKVVMQVRDGNSLMYLPLDKLIEKRDSMPETADQSAPLVTTPALSTSKQSPLRSSTRTEGVR